MSILIKGMEMPNNCMMCPLSVLNGERLWCEITKEEVLRAKIDSDCPLIEQKTGEWNSKMLDKFRKYEVVCSECGARYIGNYDAYDEPYDFNYCPNCGARMVKE